MPLHEPVTDLPFFGDSTANEALLFSPPFHPPPPSPQPTFPNYTLPQANISLPPAPDPQNSPNFTLFLAPLSTGLTSLPQTACAIRAGVTSNAQAAQSAQVLAEQLWLRDAQGWRKEWLVGQLTPLTNYSVYAIQDDTRLSGPMYFTTKSGASFVCSLGLVLNPWIMLFSVILVSSRPRAALLPDHGILRPPSCTARLRPCVRLVQPAIQPIHNAPQLPHQLQHEPAHHRLWP